MVLSFFGIINVGKAHSESACHCNTLKLHSRWISFFVISMCVLGIGNASHYIVLLLPLTGEKLAYNPSHLWSRWTAPQSLVRSTVMMLVEQSGVCNHLPQLLGDLPFCILHLEFAWGILCLQVCAEVIWMCFDSWYCSWSGLLIYFLISLIGSEVSSSAISFIEKLRTIPKSFRVILSRMSLNSGVVMISLSYSIILGCTKYSLLAE